MAEALVSLEDALKRCDWEVTDAEKSDLQEAILDLSEDARTYGMPSWTHPDRTPAQIIRLVGRAAARYLKNSHGYTTSRAADETVSWSDVGPDAGGAHFTPSEIEALRSYRGGMGAIASIPVIGWGTREGAVPSGYHYAPVEGGGKPFPWPNESDVI